jgi:hypothetical protein
MQTHADLDTLSLHVHPDLKTKQFRQRPKDIYPFLFQRRHAMRRNRHPSCLRFYGLPFPDSDTALQALVSSLAPGGASGAESLSKEDVTKLSEKLKELLGDADLPQGGVQTNERGEVRVSTCVKLHRS